MLGKRYSRQREAVYNALVATDQHPTAEELYNELRVEHPNISLGTVYRNLNRLSELGEITKIPLSVERYDGNTTPHPHFYCKSCNRFTDINIISDAEFSGFVEKLRASGYEINNVLFLLEGKCQDCKSDVNK